MQQSKRRRVGNQTPTFRIAPNSNTTDGDIAIKLAAGYGFVLDPWQRTVVTDWMARDRGGKWAATTCGLWVPRQNGKTGNDESAELYWASVLGEKVLHTAHEVKTMRKSFMSMLGFFDNKRSYPELFETVEDIRHSSGEQAIMLKNGGSIEYSSRSTKSARGFTVDKVVCDEAQLLTDDELSALMYAMSAGPQGNPQLILMGTPPIPGSPGTVFLDARKAAHAGTDKLLCWHEWAVDEVGDVTDKERWYRTNPGLGVRITERAVGNELKRSSTDSFARERLGWGASTSGVAVIKPDDWKACATDDPPEDGLTVYGVKFSPDGATVALAVAVKTDESIHTEIVEYRSMSEGISWLASWLIERQKKAAVIVIDGLSSAQSLVELLDQARVPSKEIVIPRANDVVAAASMMLNAIKEHTMTHYDQPDLNTAALGAQRRPIGARGGWGFGSGPGTDVTPLEAATLALWGASTTKRNPNRKQRAIW